MDKNDGIFCMTFEDYLKYFNVTAICAVKSSEDTSTQVKEFDPDQTQHQISFELKNDLDCYNAPIFF